MSNQTKVNIIGLIIIASVFKVAELIASGSVHIEHRTKDRKQGIAAVCR